MDDEIIDGEFLSIEQIDTMLAKGEKFCPDTLVALERVRSMIHEGKLQC